MKHLFHYILTIAAALTIAACEDVPMPYNTPGSSTDDDATTATARGDGTKDNPYNAVGVTQYIEENLASGESSSTDVYITGRVSSVKECSASYGNATFYLSDDGTSDNTFYVYRCYGLNNKKIDSDDAVQVGDSITVYGQVTNYSGTYETVQNGAYIVYSSRLGSSEEPTPAGDPAGTGTQDDPYNVAAAEQVIASGSASSDKVYVSGTVSQVDASSFDSSYGSLIYYISDDGTTSNQLEVYRGYGLGGNKFTSADGLKVGDKVVVYGVLTLYYSTAEITSGSQLYSLNGQTSSSDESSTSDVLTATNGVFINESFASSFGVFTAKTVKGTAWTIDYSTAKATGYDNSSSTTTASEAYLVSKPMDMSNTTSANISFDYILRYYTSNGTVKSGVADKVLITDNYTDDPTTTNWTDITGTLTEGSDWSTFYTYSTDVPSDFLGKDRVVVALYYACESNSATWEVKNFKVAENGGSTGGDTGGDNQGGEVSGNSITFTASSLGLDNATAVTTVTLSDGTTLTFDDGGNTNAPKYYTNGKNIRMYPNNTVAIASSKTISSVVFACDTYQSTICNASGDVTASPGTVSTSGSDLLVTDIASKDCTITNASSSTGAASQIRFTSLTITYAE